MSPIRMEKIESAARTVLEFNEAFNRHHVPAMMRLMTDDCVFENTAPAPDGTIYKGKEAVTRFWDEFFRESPSAHIEIEDIFGMGNTHCVMRWKYSWGNVMSAGWMFSNCGTVSSAKNCRTRRVNVIASL